MFSQGILSQNWGGTEPNHSVTCMVLKAKAIDRRGQVWKVKVFWRRDKMSFDCFWKLIDGSWRNFDGWSFPAVSKKLGMVAQKSVYLTQNSS
ncbi:hypothetical protein TNCV_3503301 [Trichonephila clavipes]|uniref:Uncharacterized protein n=1 Tax=Trichonephila clavipes TaxID=2585209 RepID=A0A8X6V7R4_TRICX|nr:hypothetical protein TNCV_3503301 [Trichonephila clavipes]